MPLMNISKFGNVKPVNVFGFFFIWWGICVISIPTAYMIIISIINPPPDFLLQPYWSTIVLEVLMAVVISFLNVRNKKSSPSNMKRNISANKKAAKEDKVLKERNLLAYFTRSFLLILGVFGLFDFAYLTYLSPSGQKVMPYTMMQSAVYGGLIGLLFTIIRFRGLRRKRRKMPEQTR